MKNKIFFTLILLFFSLINVLGQDKLLLEQKNKPNRKKYIDLDREYYIKTSDTAYSYKKIVDFTDTTLSITTLSKTNKNTTLANSQTIKMLDTIIITFTDIHTLKKD